MSVILLLFAALAASVIACGDGHDHSHARRAEPQQPLTPPTRPLEWGDINVIHTTDTHGWLLGHQKASFPEPNYSGDFGDFSSFVTHMKELALKKDVDLLLVDSGDIHDGTGLSDGFPVGGVDGQDSNEFLKKLPYDVMVIGNHELYNHSVTLDMYQNFVPALKGRYLSSNAYLTFVDKDNKVVNVPVGNRFVKFKTQKGRKVSAFGVIFNFSGNDENTTVQKVEDMVKEQWFLDAIQEEPDFFLLVGHMPVAQDNWPLVFNTIRAVHAYTPILILGGHTHIRDCVQLDGRSMSLESGCYMETVGWLSAKLDHKGSTKNLTFSRRYLDPNRVTYAWHTGKNDTNFDTLEGLSITQGLKDLAKRFNIDFVFGTAPHDFLLDRAPYPSENSELSLFVEKATPYALGINNTRADIPNIIILASGSQRYHVYAGPFTRDDQFIACPRTNTFVYISDVPLSTATAVFAAMNEAGEQRRALLGDEDDEELYAQGNVDRRYRAWLREMDRKHGQLRRDTQNLTLGYVTTDSCPGVGDDIPHAPLTYYDHPDFIASITPTGIPDDAPIDLIFFDFITTQVLETVNSLQSAKNYTTADVQSYSTIIADEVLGLYAQAAWN